MKFAASLVGIALSGALFAQTDKVHETRISGVSMFKNGYAVVLRETTIPHSQPFLIPGVPAAALGTFWLNGSNGVKISEAVSTTITQKSLRPVTSLDEILMANVGKQITLHVMKPGEMKAIPVVGKLVTWQGPYIVVEGLGNTTVSINKSNIHEISGETGTFSYQLPADTVTRVIRLQANAPAGGKVYTISLERGLSWAPAYAVELLDDQKLRVTGKATIINELGDLSNVEARLITGFPNIRFIGSEDPFTSSQSMFQFLQGLNGFAAPGGPGGGGGGLASNSQRAREADAGDMEGFTAMTPSNLEGFQAEDLFFYRRPGVTLKPGERGYYVLFEGEGAFEQYFTTELNAWTDMSRDPSVPADAADVWNTIQFKNPINQPLTTAAATVMKNGEILGQDMMTYTSAGGTAKLKITKAMDINVRSESEMINRVPSDIKDRDGRVIYDIVTVRGKVSAISLRPKNVDLRISYTLDGELRSNVPTGEVTKSTTNLAQINPRSIIRWKANMEPGKKQEFTFEYTTLVPAR